jgi:hypothetical protein
VKRDVEQFGGSCLTDGGDDAVNDLLAIHEGTIRTLRSAVVPFKL